MPLDRSGQLSDRPSARSLSDSRASSLDRSLDDVQAKSLPNPPVQISCKPPAIPRAPPARCCSGLSPAAPLAPGAATTSPTQHCTRQPHRTPKLRAHKTRQERGISMESILNGTTRAWPKMDQRTDKVTARSVSPAAAAVSKFVSASLRTRVRSGSHGTTHEGLREYSRVYGEIAEHPRQARPWSVI